MQAAMSTAEPNRHAKCVEASGRIREILSLITPEQGARIGATLAPIIG